MQKVLDKGHSRVPVYYEKKTNIIGLILVMLSSFSKQSYDSCKLYLVFCLDETFFFSFLVFGIYLFMPCSIRLSRT